MLASLSVAEGWNGEFSGVQPAVKRRRAKRQTEATGAPALKSQCCDGSKSPDVFCHIQQEVPGVRLDCPTSKISSRPPENHALRCDETHGPDELVKSVYGVFAKCNDG